MTIIEIDDFKNLKGTTMLHLEKHQAIKLNVTLEELISKVIKERHKGIEILAYTAGKEHSIRVGLWSEKDESQ